MQKIAIIGCGIAGLGAAYRLKNRAVTLFDGNNYVGGHANTIDVKSAGADTSFDTGFMVFNYQTYPLLTALFSSLSVPVKKTDMSFSVQYIPDRLEWNGAGLDKIFARRGNLINIRFWRMLMRLDWFNKNAAQHLNQPDLCSLTVAQYVEKFCLGEDFLNWYLIPMGAAVWSTAPSRMLEFPIATLIRFFHNHGFLGLDTHYQWYTVDGGARNYVDRLLQSLNCEVRLNEAALAVERHERSVDIITTRGKFNFDQVILACHADQALALLANPSSLERSLLGPFHYERNEVLVHTDSSVMPQARRAWASWNYRVERPGGAGADILASTHYWMNNLQGLNTENFFVSLNSAHLVRPDKIVRRLEYSHPLFDLETSKAQSRLHDLNRGPVYFCGSYFRYGFHEDALASAWNLCDRLEAVSACS